MEQNNVFTGMGHSPDGVDLPLGFGMKLAQQPKAMDAFGRLTTRQKAEVVRYIQGGATGDDAQRLIQDAISKLKENRFFYSKGRKEPEKGASSLLHAMATKVVGHSDYLLPLL